jgi:enamine deaminase RidA (YjgF/YER057c/UK114 family)
MTHRVLQPPGWPRPKGYANGIEAEGRLVFTAGVVGWNAAEKFEAKDLVGQFRQTLENTKAILAEAGARSGNIVRMTWYITDRADYLGKAKEIGAVWRAAMGKVFPCIAVVEVKSLMEAAALIEIETTAVVPR